MINVVYLQYSLLSLDKAHSAGSLLLEVIENWEQSLNDPYKVWFACDILSHIVRNNERAKDIAGSIVFGDESKGEDPVPLLHQIVAQLLMSTKNPSTNARVPIGYLCLLCTWLYDSPASVSLFLAESTHVQFVSRHKADKLLVLLIFFGFVS